METTSERRKDTILNMAKTESRTRYGLKGDYEEERKGETNEIKCKRFFIFY
jgi:hypothetical protein